MTEDADLDLARRRIVAEAACSAAAEVHLKYRRPAIAFETKDGNTRDLVTIADTEAQAAAVAIIADAFPGEAIIGEEDGVAPGRVADVLRDHGWLIDPLDGTFNYVHGFPDFSATVAFVQGGEPVAGATYAALLGEMFSAARGLGATLNDAPIHVSARSGLARSIVNVWLGPRDDMTAHARLGRVHAVAFQQRVFGGTAIVMAYLAAGRFDLFYVAENGRMGPWDLAAGAVLISEAGGAVTTLDGAPFRLPANQIAACADPATLDELRRLLKD